MIEQKSLLICSLILILERPGQAIRPHRCQVLLLLFVCIYSKSVLVLPGQSTITFIYDFVESFKGPHPGYAVLSGRPQAGTLHTIKQFYCFTTLALD